MMKEWEERLIYEGADLTINLIKLARFMRTSEYSMLTTPEKQLLTEQLDAMESYQGVLASRIEALGQPRRPKAIMSF